MRHREIIIFSDVHASLEAVEAICDYMDQHQIDLVLNLGDFISGGKNPCEVFDKLMMDKRFINIKGYDEECLFNNEKANTGIGEGKWLIEKLGKTRINLLKKLPSTKEIMVNDHKILMCHNNGWSDLKQLEAHTRKNTGKKYQLIAYGGSHLQELTHSKKIFYGCTLIDPGALKENNEHQGQFAVVNFGGKALEINFRSVCIEEKPYIATKVVFDKTNMENEDKKEDTLLDTFLYIKGSKKEETNRLYIADEVIDKIIDIGIKQCKYISIGCWSEEKLIVKELLYYLKCRAIRRSEEDQQEWYIGEITKEVQDLIKNHRKAIDGKLKWFEISFQNSLDNEQVLYSVYHYGKEGFLKRLSTKELYNMEELLERYNLLYYLLEENKKKV